ncbi:MAG TPA: ABC transporter substrate-binding protein [Stellaceae bacterium]|nr:ABC transporter substrate-binding protein [Stellaceae bacterium]
MGWMAALAFLACAAAQARAAENVELGAVGAANAVVWPHYIAEKQGFYAAEGLAVHIFYSQTGAAMLQALTSGSTKMGIAAGIADPMNAFAAGAGIAIVRIDGQSGPYAVIAKKGFKSIKDLKGHVVTVDEARGATMVYFNKMLEGNGMTRKDVDFSYAGSTAARFAALEAGAVDAAILTAPQLFTAEGRGFVNLGYAVDYAKDVPFTADLVNRAWVATHEATARKFLDAYAKAIAWFDDPKNKDAAIELLHDVTKMDQPDIAKSYDFLHKIDFFDRSNHVDEAKIATFYKAFRELDPSFTIDVKKLVMQLE